MLLEIASIYLNRNSTSKSDKNEKFTEKNKKENKPSDLLMLVYMILFVIWVGISLLLWFRVVIYAFKCGGFTEGISSILLPSHYGLYKFGDLIKLSCD